MNNWTEFDELLKLIGPSYSTRRDALLKSNVDVDAKLQNELKRTEWMHRSQAAILLAWRDDKSKMLFQTILTELDDVDFELERKKVTGILRIWEEYTWRAKEVYHADVLPLCWEVVLKHSEDWPEWKVNTILRMLAVLPDDNSTWPLIQFIETTKSEVLLEVGLYALGHQPNSAVLTAIDQRKTQEPALSTVVATALNELKSKIKVP